MGGGKVHFLISAWSFCERRSSLLLSHIIFLVGPFFPIEERLMVVPVHTHTHIFYSLAFPPPLSLSGT
jgi:hypothetical protein